MIYWQCPFSFPPVYESGSVLLLSCDPTSQVVVQSAEETPPTSDSLRDVPYRPPTQLHTLQQEQILSHNKLEEQQNVLCTRTHDGAIVEETQHEESPQITTGNVEGVEVNERLVEPQSESSSGSSSSSNSQHQAAEQKQQSRLVVSEFTKNPEGMVMVVNGRQSLEEDKYGCSDNVTASSDPQGGGDISEYKHEEQFKFAEERERSDPLIMQEEHRTSEEASCTVHSGQEKNQEYVWWVNWLRT